MLKISLFVPISTIPLTCLLQCWPFSLRISGQTGDNALVGDALVNLDPSAPLSLSPDQPRSSRLCLFKYTLDPYHSSFFLKPSPVHSSHSAPSHLPPTVPICPHYRPYLVPYFTFISYQILSSQPFVTALYRLNISTLVPPDSICPLAFPHQDPPTAYQLFLTPATHLFILAISPLFFQS